MSSTPVTQRVYEQRSEKREHDSVSAKTKIDEENRKELEKQQEEHAKEVKERQEEATRQVNEAASKLQKLRLQHSEELTRVRAEIALNIKEQQEIQSTRGMEEVEATKKELEKKREKLEHQAELLQFQLDETLQIMGDRERMRQEAVKEVNMESEEQKKEHQEKILAKNDELQQQRIATEAKINEVAKASQEEQVEMIARTQDKQLSGFMNVQVLTRSLALQDNFHPFQQMCEALRKQHGKFITAYDDLEPTLLKCDERMKRGKRFEDFDMTELQDALRLFRGKVDEFSSKGSTDEIEFGNLIGQLIELITTLNTKVNNIDAKVALFNEETEGEDNISEEIIAIKTELEKMAPLIQKFNVIPRQHFAETLAIQMQNVQATSNGRFALEGPPVYRKKEKLAIE